MSFRDKVRDEIYGNGKNESEVEQFASEILSVTEIADRPLGAQKLLAISVAAEIAAVISAVFGLRYVRLLFDDLYLALFGPVLIFLIGFFAAYGAFKIYKDEIAQDDDIYIKSGIRSGFADYERRQSQFTIYLVSAAGGVANVLLVFALMSI